VARAASDAVKRVLDRLKNVKPSSNGWTARCPAHPDQERWQGPLELFRRVLS